MDLPREPKTEKTTDVSRNLNVKKFWKYLFVLKSSSKDMAGSWTQCKFTLIN